MTANLEDTCRGLHQFVERLRLGEADVLAEDLDLASVALSRITENREWVMRHTGGLDFDAQLTRDVDALHHYFADAQPEREAAAALGDLQAKIAELHYHLHAVGDGEESDLFGLGCYHQGVIDAAARDYRIRNGGARVPEGQIRLVTRNYAKLVLHEAAQTYGWDKPYALFRRSSTIPSTDRFGVYVASSMPLGDAESLEHRLLIFDRKYHQWHKADSLKGQNLRLKEALASPMDILKDVYPEGISIGWVMELNEHERGSYVSSCSGRYCHGDGEVVQVPSARGSDALRFSVRVEFHSHS